MFYVLLVILGPPAYFVVGNLIYKYMWNRRYGGLPRAYEAKHMNVPQRDYYKPEPLGGDATVQVTALLWPVMIPLRGIYLGWNWVVGRGTDLLLSKRFDEDDEVLYGNRKKARTDVIITLVWLVFTIATTTVYYA